MKYSLRLTISLLAVPALRARARSVARVNRDQRHPCQPRLVGQEQAKLAESPSVLLASLRLRSSSYSLPDVGEFLDCHAPQSVFCLRHNTLADSVMVGPALERQPVEELFGEGDAGQPVARFIEATYHLEQDMALLRYKRKLYRQCHVLDFIGN
jgi:hypothetical protein